MKIVSFLGVKEDFKYKWFDTTEEYTVIQYITEDEQGRYEVQIGQTEREAYKLNRKRIVVFIEGYPFPEITVCIPISSNLSIAVSRKTTPLQHYILTFLTTLSLPLFLTYTQNTFSIIFSNKSLKINFSLHIPLLENNINKFEKEQIKSQMELKDSFSTELLINFNIFDIPIFIGLDFGLYNLYSKATLNDQDFLNIK